MLELNPPETTAVISPVESPLQATSVLIMVSIFKGVTDCKTT